MPQLSCPFCEYVIKANDIDQEVLCDNCGRRFPIESGDVCYIENKKSNSSSTRKVEKTQM